MKEPQEVDVIETFRVMQDVLQVVLQMRRAQRHYFASKKKDDLIEAKRLEAAVDVRLGQLGIR